MIFPFTQRNYQNRYLISHGEETLKYFRDRKYQM